MSGMVLSSIDESFYAYSTTASPATSAATTTTVADSPQGKSDGALVAAAAESDSTGSPPPRQDSDRQQDPQQGPMELEATAGLPPPTVEPPSLAAGPAPPLVGLSASDDSSDAMMAMYTGLSGIILTPADESFCETTGGGPR